MQLQINMEEGQYVNTQPPNSIQTITMIRRSWLCSGFKESILPPVMFGQPIAIPNSHTDRNPAAGDQLELLHTRLDILLSCVAIGKAYTNDGAVIKHL